MSGGPLQATNVKGLIARTQELNRDHLYLEQLRLVDYEQSVVRTEEMNLRWYEVSELSRRVPLWIDISPSTSAMKSFKYLLTEYPNQHHRQWFRFRVAVNGETASASQIHEFTVSGQPLEKFPSGSVRVSDTSIRSW